MECKVFVPCGALGSGIAEDSLARGMNLLPDIISCDAGSTDSGPYYLGTGKGKYARSSVKHDLKLVIMAAHKAGIPITIGSASTCGSDSGVDEVAAICREVCEEEGIKAKVTLIYSEQDSKEMKKRFEEGKVSPLPGAPNIEASVFDSCSHIVGLAGVEPFIKALQDGADIVICGRSTDTAVLAAMPIIRGCDEASAWHGAKVCECGGLCTTNPMSGAVFLTVTDKGFIVEAVGENAECTPYSVSAHLLYENSDPIHLTEPGIEIDVSGAVYTQLENGRVYVEGAKLKRSEHYTMKLEGSGPNGFQTVILSGIRDRDVMKAPMEWIKKISLFMEDRFKKVGVDRSRFSYSIRPYGYNAVYGGKVPDEYVPNEIGMLLVVTADSQDLATQVAKLFNPYMLHFPMRTDTQLPSYAFPFSPSEIERGQIYEFKLNHVVMVDDPMELVRFKTLDF